MKERKGKEADMKLTLAVYPGSVSLNAPGISAVCGLAVPVPPVTLICAHEM